MAIPSNGNVTVINWCPGDPCDPCANCSWRFIGGQFNENILCVGPNLGFACTPVSGSGAPTGSKVTGYIRADVAGKDAILYSRVPPPGPNPPDYPPDIHIYVNGNEVFTFDMTKATYDIQIFAAVE